MRGSSGNLRVSFLASHQAPRNCLYVRATDYRRFLERAPTLLLWNVRSGLNDYDV